MHERVLYYWAKLFSSSLGEGHDYTELTPTIMISILNYPLFPNKTDNFHNVFHIAEDEEMFLWSPHLEIHLFDLTKFLKKWKKYRRELKKNPPKELPWLMMLSLVDYRKKTLNEEIFLELEEFAMNEQEVREALIEWETLSANKENRVLYEARRKYLLDQLSNLRGQHRKGREEGLKEGIKEGRKEEKQAIAKKLLTKGMDEEIISEITGLSQQEIREIT